jgi:hypothetical protein
MQLAADLADRLYSLLVETIGAPDDYRRWSFIYAHTELTVSKYSVDSKLSCRVFFLNRRPLMLECDDPSAETTIKHVNALIREIAEPKKAKRVRQVPVANAQPPVTIPVQRASDSQAGSPSHA